MSKQNPGHVARKRFGQNFLHDPTIIGRIISAINPKPDQHLVEIGPGLGALTEEILLEAGALEAVELDRDLIPVLRTKFFRYEGKFTIHEADALKFDFASLQNDERPLRVVGNLPYNISTPLIFHLLSFSGLISDMHFMLQKEVVERLAAQPGEDHYGRLGIMAQYYCKVEKLFIVPPGAFNPAPKVDSAIVRLIPHTTLPIEAKDPNLLADVVRTAFGQRRKTLRNNMKGLITGEQLEALGIDPGLRPERLSLAQFIAISDAIHSLRNE
ncbi:16S rRNA (adenine(1518)-N(6)/adenine(1519)-N(6))-dimethyltransferase RsmA [Marinobacterium sp. LSUCC0821]|uniref:16S rRNA (adenine(1518)-N(6)/adenine(1519)-N(6))- dimethyltransferase RsmA n=1 Tax=Marinobacterium sp. LSUCC0821 TaxID=2668067 RepID=UPI0014519BC6|nr:16S rRNA (adenine(1518)-N(6)/adenine(1519)-N(6))-dimethyltransferase RsmA [Marinobacterium sp. LSUCC0821]QJD71397.1 16S rRNA (adenine(1518)-N(6)/adenine(1519)-N(6))-dimethyltransferase RsmA [Marinobacterium sp. LSUCC0821]